jgi:MoCo/4Fe-4S cofactor protein with predicted Tat translocation signal
MSEISNIDGRGPAYWRSLQELAGSEEFQLKLENEFPDGIEAHGSGLSRRRFLQIMSASLAMATLAGCRWPEEKIVPFAKREPGVAPGTPMQFATTMELGAVALSVLATSYDGRPIKIDGNPEYKLNGKATNVFAQASVLDLYDPDRSHHVLHKGKRVDWDAFQAANLGGPLAILTEMTSSPSVHGLLNRLADDGAALYGWEPVCRVNEMMGLKKAYGTAARTSLDLKKAQVVVDFDANVLQDHPTAVRNSGDFAKGRAPDSGHMNRLYVYENTFSITGGMADHRFPTPSGAIGEAVWALAARLFLVEGLALPARSGLNRQDLQAVHDRHIDPDNTAAVARDLMANRGRSLLVTGVRQDADTHALVHVLNTALGNVGQTISYQPIDLPPLQPVDKLVADLKSGRIKTLLILGGDPVYNAPVDLDFTTALQNAATTVHLSDRVDATSRLCDWHLPRAHYLESWGDAVGWDGTRLAVQPLIQPLYKGRTSAEILSMLADETPRNGYQITRDSFNGGRAAPQNNPAFEKRWRKFIHDGLLQDSAGQGRALDLKADVITPPHHGDALGSDNLEIVFSQDPSLYDGRFANNAWLQEMPDFMSKLTWDNAALISPATADELHVQHGDLIDLSYEGRNLEMPVYVLPGQAKYSVTVNLGYGRKDAGKVADGAGFNAYALRTLANQHHGSGLKISATGRSYPLAITQDHHAIDDAGAKEIQRRVPGLVREGTLDQYHADEHFVDHMGVHSPPLKSLWKEHEYTGNKWGMAIDLNTCTGCNACLLGCQSENNIPVVGKDEVERGREMAWIRLDRYFLGDPEDPKCVQQAVNCAQCELAPCEEVCPVAATVHTDEGLNAMVYNRCVGTRYCSNNCPYKVRRFNWFNNFEDLTETQRMVQNPNVTVRARGVMEKCTYCVQRIEEARVQARVEGRELKDGDITPACAQTCPTDAIVFGDMNDAESRVAKLREKNRSYDLLNYLNLKPRTFYLARIRNPNPEIEPAAHADGGGHGTGH